MTDANKRVVGLGNAIVDILVTVDEATITRNKLEKGGMDLVSEEESWSLYKDLGPSSECSGGSVANTVAHLAGAGVPATFVGKVADDEFGKVFTHDLNALGVDVPTSPVAQGEGPGTGRSIVMITPDGQRTMSTFLGAAVTLNAPDVAAAMPDAFELLFIEGYLWDAPDGPAAIEEAAKRAKSAGAEVAVTLSDAGCVLRHIDEMREFVEQYADILIANEHEAGALARAPKLDDAIAYVRETVRIAAVTRSGDGSVVVNGNVLTNVPPEKVDEVVDSTGAGDAYAAGFLAAYLKGEELPECGREGGRLAARVIQHIGAREMDVQKLANAG